MGIFANQPEDGMPGWIGPGVEVPGTSGFDALGKPVPFYRRQAGYDACKSMGMEDRESIWDLIGQMSDKIERDEPHAAMELAVKKLDVTGVYRLLATLLSAEKPRVRVKAGRA